MNGELIARSLELVGERGDPTLLVYQRLFAAHPEMERLFVRDTTGAIKGNMLAEVLTALLDFVGPNSYGGNLMRVEIVNHENLGVPPQVYATFFSAMRDAFAEILGRDWTPEIDEAWRALVARIDDLLRR